MPPTLVQLDDQFRRDHLGLTLGLLIVSAAGIILVPRFLRGGEIAFAGLFLLTGIFFVHQFGIRGGPLAIGFMAIVVLAGVVGLPWVQGLSLAAAGVLSAGSVGLYSAWIQDIQTEQTHRSSAETELRAWTASANSGVADVTQKLSKQEAQVETWTSLVDVVRGCSSTLKFDQLSDFVLSAVESLFPDDRVSLWVEAAGESTDSHASSHASEAGRPARRYQRRAYEPQVPDGLDRLAAIQQKNILVVDQEKDSRFQTCGEYRFSGRSALTCPLLEENQVYGNLRVTSMAPERFNHEDMVMLSHIAGVISMSASNVRLYERTEELALTDGQTGLFKRYYFEKRFGEECKRALRKSTSIALILIDIDHFKRVNDTYGHSVGDRVLQQVGKAVREVDWGGPLPCRWGGEEFLIALPDATPSQAMDRAKSLSKRIKSIPFHADEDSSGARDNTTVTLATFFVTVSMGLAGFPIDSGDPDQLFQIADRRLYAAKNSGRDRIVDHD